MLYTQRSDILPYPALAPYGMEGNPVRKAQARMAGGRDFDIGQGDHDR
jgi:hypothetical protein